jgi:glycosyltransferase involved in cell wall biosynthesis
MLIEAFSRLDIGGDDVEVLFAGPIRNEEYFQELCAFAKSKGIAENIEFLGWRDDIPELLGKSDIMVLTSRQEGVPHVVREAMFAQVPVVATAVGGVPEAVENGETGFLVALDDVESLRKSLIRLLKSPDEREEMGRAGLELAQERFSRESWLTEYYNLLQNLT